MREADVAVAVHAVQAVVGEYRRRRGRVGVGKAPLFQDARKFQAHVFVSNPCHEKSPVVIC